MEIFLAKVNGGGADDVEELCAHGCDAAEEDGTGGAFEEGSEWCYCDEGAGALGLRRWWEGGVHYLCCWSEDGGDSAVVGVVGREVSVERVEFLEVRGKGARVAGEVFADAELCRVDVDGDEDVVVLGGGGAREAEVAGVEGSHGGDETDAVGEGAEGIAVGAEFCGCAEDIDLWR